MPAKYHTVKRNRMILGKIIFGQIFVDQMFVGQMFVGQMLVDQMFVGQTIFVQETSTHLIAGFLYKNQKWK